MWDLVQGRCVKTIEAHGHFVTCMAWGCAILGGGAPGADGKEAEPRRINVIATGSVDQTVKVGLLSQSSRLVLISDMDAIVAAWVRGALERLEKTVFSTEHRHTPCIRMESPAASCSLVNHDVPHSAMRAGKKGWVCPRDSKRANYRKQ